MTLLSNARRAYAATTKSTGTPRAMEHKVISDATSALRRGEKLKNENYAEYINALSRNLRIWTVFGADAAHEQNALPAEMRSQIFYLFEFTRHHTMKIMQGDKSVDASPLIEINNRIMSGLRSSGGSRED